MWLAVAILVLHTQDSELPLPPNQDRSVPLVKAKSKPAAKPKSKKLVGPEGRGPNRLTEKTQQGPNFGSLALWTCAVLALMAGSFVLFKRFTRNSKFLGANPMIDVIGRKGLGPKQAIFLVEIGGKVLVVGSTRDRLATLGEIADPDTVASLKVRSGRAQADSSSESFRASLKSGLREPERKDASARRGEVHGLLDELSELKKTVSGWRA